MFEFMKSKYECKDELFVLMCCVTTDEQARRKMITIPSPPHASSAPDLLADILESQTLLHSRNSVVSVTVDGNVNIKLETRESRHQPKPDKKKDAPLADKKEVDLTKGEGSRQAPSYPGQGRGWGGGYRYPREHNNYQQNHNQGNQGYFYFKINTFYKTHSCY